MDRNRKAEMAIAINAFAHLLKEAMPIAISPRALATTGQRDGVAEMANTLRGLITDQMGTLPGEVVVKMEAWVDCWYAASALAAIAEAHSNEADRVAGERAYEECMDRVQDLYEELRDWHDGGQLPR